MCGAETKSNTSTAPKKEIKCKILKYFWKLKIYSYLCVIQRYEILLCIVMVSKSPFDGEGHCSNQCRATKLFVNLFTIKLYKYAICWMDCFLL